MVDMAHFAGLVAGKVFTGDYNPVAHAHIVTSTTHKTLRGRAVALCYARMSWPNGWIRVVRPFWVGLHLS